MKTIFYLDGPRQYRCEVLDFTTEDFLFTTVMCPRSRMRVDKEIPMDAPAYATVYTLEYKFWKTIVKDYKKVELWRLSPPSVKTWNTINNLRDEEQKEEWAEIINERVLAWAGLSKKNTELV